MYVPKANDQESMSKTQGPCGREPRTVHRQSQGPRAKAKDQELCMHETDQTNKRPCPPHAGIPMHGGQFFIQELNTYYIASNASHCHFSIRHQASTPAIYMTLYLNFNDSWNHRVPCNEKLAPHAAIRIIAKLESRLAPRLPAPFLGDVAIVLLWDITA